ncbi:peptidase M43 family protein [Metarhizium robertsii]|uniref:Peptidase M43 family protein n=1 Tax=Metarhizium robertsii TaxID=568076 RepID=A0A014P5N1_9HYPO|nr:peptidase M43 family protein [Metarhizium robertsii]
MQLIRIFIANILALYITFSPVIKATTLTSIRSNNCNWEAASKLDTIQNEHFPRTNTTDSRVLTVGVYMHVSTFIIIGLLKQLNVLNKSFKPANISFTLLDIDWTNKTLPPRPWFVRPQLLKDLRKGNLSTLNLFFLQEGRDEWFGSTTSIHAILYKLNGLDEKSDGSLINIDTVPGGPHPFANMGKTAVHEIGHWFQLGHTSFIYKEHCQLDRQNRQVKPGTNINNSTCSNCDYNYMSYGNDACLQEFTSEQIKIMRSSGIKLRKL